jgi:hypothetical protein
MKRLIQNLQAEINLSLKSHWVREPMPHVDQLLLQPAPATAAEPKAAATAALPSMPHNIALADALYFTW